MVIIILGNSDKTGRIFDWNNCLFVAFSAGYCFLPIQKERFCTSCEDQSSRRHRCAFDPAYPNHLIAFQGKQHLSLISLCAQTVASDLAASLCGCSQPF